MKTPTAGARGARWCFLRGLGLVWMAAFLSLWVQVDGLIGPDGILPATEALDGDAGSSLGERLLQQPSLFWLDASSPSLIWGCLLGAGAGLLLTLNVHPLLSLLTCWCLYLSFVTVGGPFLQFQWDVLLLESSVVGMLIAPVGARPGWGKREPSRLGQLLLRLLVLRLYFWSGALKLMSGDEAWSSLTALQHHFETQPLPRPLAWQAHHLPEGLLQMATGLTLGIELLAPLLLFIPSKRRLGGALLVLLMALVELTGNFGFFPLLCVVLIAGCMDDLSLPARLRPRKPTPLKRRWQAELAALPVMLTVTLLGLARSGQRLGLDVHPESYAVQLDRLLRPFKSFNHYGLFITMTEERPELSLEVSKEGLRWSPVRLAWKIEDPLAPPPLLFLHLPRLDWCMWFAALREPSGAPWMLEVERALERQSPAAWSLLHPESLELRGETKRLRVMRHRYRFSSLSERRRTGAWWILEGGERWDRRVDIGR